MQLKFSIVRKITSNLRNDFKILVILALLKKERMQNSHVRIFLQEKTENEGHKKCFQMLNFLLLIGVHSSILSFLLSWLLTRLPTIRNANGSLI